MPENSQHITVCICTYKRPQYLDHLVQELCLQGTGWLFSYSIVVTDNDREQSAKNVVTNNAGKSSIQITYDSEPEQNIALARNRALANATGEFIAFIDDDELPV